MARSLVLRMALLGLLGLACARDPAPAEPAASVKPVSKSAPSSRPEVSPVAMVESLGPVRPEEGYHGGAQPPPSKPLKEMKTSGKLGELLEGTHYHFKLLSLGNCSSEPIANPDDPKARVWVGANVEITAKEALNVSPRDVRLGQGGISFTADVKPGREVKGCTPLLPISRLRANQVAKGFVLFELPTAGPGSNLKELSLGYQPTRFGGASQVLVPPGSH